MRVAGSQDENSLRVELTQGWLTFGRFVRRFGPSVATLIVAALAGWLIANSVSNYTHGGWEIHFEQRFEDKVLVNIHIHHWYYGVPLFFVALLLIRVNVLASTFVLGLGEALSAHSFLNEHGIPSIIEGGPTWNVPNEVYFPIVTALSLLYALFLIRREEWLVRERERERISASYIGPAAQLGSTFRRVDNWARKHFTKKKIQHDLYTQVWYGEWSGLDASEKGEWQLHYTATPYEADKLLWVFSLEHIPISGSVGLIDDWMHELDDALGPTLEPALLREPAPAQPLVAAGE